MKVQIFYGRNIKLICQNFIETKIHYGQMDISFPQ